MNPNLYISLDNGKIYYNQKSSKEILYFDNNYPFDDEKPKIYWNMIKRLNCILKFKN